MMNELQKQFDGQVRIVRSAFRPSSSFQTEHRLQICPSYLFFNDGELVDRCDGPTMLPVLMSKLSNLVSSEPGRSAAIHHEVQP